MRIRVTVPEEHVSPEVIDPVLEAVTRLNEAMIENGDTPTASALVDAGATWKPEPPGDEMFDHGGTIAERGWGDCDDWAPLRAAELRQSGEDPQATARVIPSGPNTYHAIVERSDGSIDDPSIAAGMKPLGGASVIGGDGTIEVFACDPHDGNVYHGSLAPTQGPMSLHCGPTFSVRGMRTLHGDIFEGRVDVPIVGSRLVRVRSYHRRPPKHHRHRHVHGALPYAVSCHGYGPSPAAALHRAFVGHLVLGAASGVSSDLDQYKLAAIQAGMSGASPGEVRSMLVDRITADVQAKAAQSGQHPAVHTNELAQELAAAGVSIPVTGMIIGDFFSDIGHMASGIVSSVSNVVHTVTNLPGIRDVLHTAESVVKAVPWGDIASGVEAAASLVPGLGTAVSDVVATAETAYDSAAALLGGHPLEAAIDAAYNFALANIPGGAALHFVLDPVKTVLVDLADKGEPVESALLDGILADVPNKPDIAGMNPRSIAASIGKLIVGHLGTKNTGTANKPNPGAQTHRPGTMAQMAAIHLYKQPSQTRSPQKAAPIPFRTAPPAPARPRPAAPRPRAPRSMPVPAPPVLHPVARAILAVKPPGVPHAAVHKDTAIMPGTPGAPPGASHWYCTPQGNGHWACRWV
jgi:hypothetical protein